MMGKKMVAGESVKGDRTLRIAERTREDVADPDVYENT
jgi:hypothetical protein